MVDFIGIGAQRTATSWLYSCMYEHPEICAPEKEIHFFSRPRYEEKGIEWYKHIFASRCEQGTKKGEFSTSYLYDPRAAARIYEHFPTVKILVSLREPTARAFSQYSLHAKVGWLDPKEVTFEEFIQTEASAKEQSLYAAQLERYYALFPKEQIHVMIKEEIDTEDGKRKVLHDLFSFLEVDPSFVPTLVGKTINSGNIPKRLWIGKGIQFVSNALYKNGLDKMVFAVKKTGIPAWIRSWNSAGRLESMHGNTEKELRSFFKDDVKKTAVLTGIDLETLWKY